MLTLYEILSLILSLGTSWWLYELIKRKFKKRKLNKKFRILYFLLKKEEDSYNLLEKLNYITIKKFKKIMDFYDIEYPSDYNHYYVIGNNKFRVLFENNKLEAITNCKYSNHKYFQFTKNGISEKQNDKKVLEDFLIYFKEQCKKNKIKIK